MSGSRRMWKNITWMIGLSIERRFITQTVNAYVRGDMKYLSERLQSPEVFNPLRILVDLRSRMDTVQSRLESPSEESTEDDKKELDGLQSVVDFVNSHFDEMNQFYLEKLASRPVADQPSSVISEEDVKRVHDMDELRAQIKDPNVENIHEWRQQFESIINGEWYRSTIVVIKTDDPTRNSVRNNLKERVKYLSLLIGIALKHRESDIRNKSSIPPVAPATPPAHEPRSPLKRFCLTCCTKYP